MSRWRIICPARTSIWCCAPPVVKADCQLLIASTLQCVDGSGTSEWVPGHFSSTLLSWFWNSIIMTQSPLWLKELQESPGYSSVSPLLFGFHLNENSYQLLFELFETNFIVLEHFIDSSPQHLILVQHLIIAKHSIIAIHSIRGFHQLCY